jgi:serine/threonine protein phosphatase PrpC
VDISRHTPKLGDILVLGSDGLNGEVPDPEILELVQQNRDDLDRGVEMLIKSACDHGGKDNVTVALVKYVED